VSDIRLSVTTSLCAVCKRSVAAEVWRRGDAVELRKECPSHGPSVVELSPNADWYLETLRASPILSPPDERRPVAQGCPFDCGPCASHEQRVLLPIVPITSACNLDCPICYTHNRNEGAFHLGEAELQSILQHLVRADPARRIINLTGGEPTQHPAFERIVELCHEAGIRRVTISTHGLRFLKDEALLERLARLDARVILSFDSFDAATNRHMLGANLLEGKLKVLNLLEKYDVQTSLLSVIAKGVNEHELGGFVELALAKPFVRSVEFHTMTFTGQSGVNFARHSRLTTYDVLAELERQTEGLLRIADFMPSPAAHPLCYSVAYVLRLRSGRWLPFTRFMSKEDLRAMLAGSLYLEPGPEMERAVNDLIMRLWAGEIECADVEEVLVALRDLVACVFAPGLSDLARLRAAESRSKAIYVHAHMDEENFDTDRIRQCCVGIREPDGSNIPSCAYNVLYRERDPRFSTRPSEPLLKLGRGRPHRS
jgi:7,8-dihydro-6-hydroxymethylpterin dimethyltransferase